MIMDGGSENKTASIHRGVNKNELE